jgi:Protein of unknown function (DUF4238)
MASKRHHYVPRFYLNYFVTDSATGGSRFWVYDKAGGPPRIQTPINTAVEGHLYSFETAPGTKDDSLEQALSALETKAKPLLDRWHHRGIAATRLEQELIAQFLAVMYSRSPKTIQGITEAKEIMGIEFARFLADRPDMIGEFLDRERLNGRPHIPSLEEMVDHLRNVEERFEIMVNRESSLIESFKLAERVAAELLDMNWCLCHAPSRTFFVTSDTPLCIFAQTSRDRALLGAGVGLPNVVVTFPISPTVCLLLDRRHTNGRMAVRKQFVREANNRMVANAERLIISAYTSDTIANLVHKYSFTRQLPKIDRSTLGRILQQRLRIRSSNTASKVVKPK